jgi:hypothetical protein
LIFAWAVSLELWLSRWSFLERSRRPLRATQTFIVSPIAEHHNTSGSGLPDWGYSNNFGALQQKLLQRTMFNHAIENATFFEAYR